MQFGSYRVICKPQWFLFCLSPYLFSEWHIVPQLYMNEKQVEDSENRCGVFIGFYFYPSPTSIQTQTQTCLPLHRHTENPRNW